MAGVSTPHWPFRVFTFVIAGPSFVIAIPFAQEKSGCLYRVQTLHPTFDSLVHTFVVARCVISQAFAITGVVGVTIGNAFLTTFSVACRALPVAGLVKAIAVPLAIPKCFSSTVLYYC